MPIEANAAFKEESRKRSTKPIFLYTVYDYKGTGEDLNFAGYDSDVDFPSSGPGKTTYTKFPITHDAISENLKGEIDGISVKLSNIARLIEYYLQTYDLRGKKLSIKLVFSNKLDDPDCYVEFSSCIDSYVSNVKDVVFSLLSKFNILNVTVPARIVSKTHCGWLFASPAIRATGKGQECGYLGTETECDRTRARCRQLGMAPRFGAFPSTPGGNYHA